MNRAWVLNASPTILLAKIGFLETLQQLCPQPLIPQGVYEEILAGAAHDPPATGYPGKDGNGFSPPSR